MSNTIGRVQFIASLDGRRTPAEAKRIGRQIGSEMGDGYDETWQSSFRDTLTKAGQRSYDTWNKNGRKDGDVYGKAFNQRLTAFLNVARKNFAGLRLDRGFLDDFARGFDSPREAAANLQKQLRTLRNENEITSSSFRASAIQVHDWVLAQEESAKQAEHNRTVQAHLSEEMRRHAEAEASSQERLNNVRRNAQIAVDRLNIDMERSNRLTGASIDLHRRAGAAVHEHSLRWRELSAGTRRWTLIIGFFAAAAEDIAALSSAVGAGLFALGGAATSGLLGVGGLAAVIVTLSKDLDKLPANLRPVAKEFQDFKTTLTQTREVIASGAFREMNGVFDTLGRTVGALSPQMQLLGRGVGDLFLHLAQNTKPGTDAFGEFQQALALAVPNFTRLGDSAGTFGLALLRSFNQAQPIVSQMLGWIETLTDRFDEFSKSRNFDSWIKTAMTTWSSFGRLLDTVSRGLNNLVTPESINRTTQFMDNLSGFIPALTGILNVLGDLNILGLLAQILDDTGAALTPLLPALEQLAAAVSTLVSEVVSAMVPALTGLSSVIAPIVQTFAAMINALPVEWVQQITGGLLALGAAFVALKGAAALSTMVTSLQTLAATSATATTVVGNLGNTLRSGLGKAGMAGAAAVGVIALSSALEAMYRAAKGTDDIARDAIASNQSLSNSYKQLGTSVFGVVTPLTNMSGALDMLDSVGTGPDKLLGTLAATFTDTGRQAASLATTLSELDPQLASLAQNNLPAATDQFRSWAQEVGANNEQLLKVINSMPEFKAALENAAASTGQLATGQELVKLAMGGTVAVVNDNVIALGELEGKSADSGKAVDDLASKIRGFGSAALDTREASRNFDQAIVDLTDSINVNGTALDDHTAAGNANQAALDALASATLEFAASTVTQTGKQADANAVIQQGRDKLIAMLGTFGIVGPAAEQYADSLGLIPKNVNTAVALQGVQAAENALGNLTRNRYVNLYVNTKTGNAGSSSPFQPALASGGVLSGPRRILAGEAGPEAIVPLHRPLAQVDPSVRWMSAIMQGKSVPGMASGGVVGGRSGPVIEAGAIVVQEAADGRKAANDLVTRIVERVHG